MAAARSRIRGAMIVSRMSPPSTMGRPRGASSKKPRGSLPDASSRPETTRFVLVPITVTVPPRMAANEIGISSRDTCRPWRRAHAWISGTITATIGVLFKTEDATETGGSKRTKLVRSVAFAESVDVTSG